MTGCSDHNDICGTLSHSNKGPSAWQPRQNRERRKEKREREERKEQDNTQGRKKEVGRVSGNGSGQESFVSRI